MYVTSHVYNSQVTSITNVYICENIGGTLVLYHVRSVRPSDSTREEGNGSTGEYSLIYVNHNSHTPSNNYLRYLLKDLVCRTISLHFH